MVQEVKSEERLLLTVNEVCQRLHLSRPTVYGLLKSRQLRGIRVGKSGHRIPARSLEEYIEASLEADGPGAA
jgi:excisionase family DNA binding protein